MPYPEEKTGDLELIRNLILRTMGKSAGDNLISTVRTLCDDYLRLQVVMRGAHNDFLLKQFPAEQAYFERGQRMEAALSLIASEEHFPVNDDCEYTPLGECDCNLALLARKTLGLPPGKYDDRYEETFPYRRKDC